MGIMNKEQNEKFVEAFAELQHQVHENAFSTAGGMRKEMMALSLP